MTREEQLNRAWADLYKANEDVFIHAIAGHDCEKQRAHREKMRAALVALGVDVDMRLDAAEARRLGGDASFADERISGLLVQAHRKSSLNDLKLAIARKEVAASIVKANHKTGVLMVRGGADVVDEVELHTRRWKVVRADD